MDNVLFLKNNQARWTLKSHQCTEIAVALVTPIEAAI